MLHLFIHLPPYLHNINPLSPFPYPSTFPPSHPSLPLPHPPFPPSITSLPYNITYACFNNYRTVHKRLDEHTFAKFPSSVSSSSVSTLCSTSSCSSSELLSERETNWSAACCDKPPDRVVQACC